MKKIIVILSVAALLMASSFESRAQLNLKNIVNSATSVALNADNGMSAGRALLGLYTQYKADGKLDLKNTSNISNLMILSSNIKGLEKLKDASAFVGGLSKGSNNLVNKNNQTDVMTALTALSAMDMSALTGTKTGSTSSTSAANVTSTVTKLLSSFGK